MLVARVIILYYRYIKLGMSIEYRKATMAKSCTSCHPLKTVNAKAQDIVSYIIYNIWYILIWFDIYFLKQASKLRIFQEINNFEYLWKVAAGNSVPTSSAEVAGTKFHGFLHE